MTPNDTLRHGTGLLILASLLAMTGVAAAQQGHFHDPVGDAPASLDIIEMAWDVQADHASVTIQLASGPDPTASYTAILYVGEPGAGQPTEWYIIHSGPGGDRVVAGHTAPVVVTSATMQSSNSTLVVHFDRVAPTSATCAFAVAQSATHGAQGRKVADSAPDEATQMATSWRSGAGCADMAGEHEDEQEAAGPELVAVIALVAGLIFVIRRRDGRNG